MGVWLGLEGIQGALSKSEGALKDHLRGQGRRGSSYEKWGSEEG